MHLDVPGTQKETAKRHAVLRPVISPKVSCPAFPLCPSNTAIPALYHTVPHHVIHREGHSLSHRSLRILLFPLCFPGGQFPRHIHQKATLPNTSCYPESSYPEGGSSAYASTPSGIGTTALFVQICVAPASNAASNSSRHPLTATKRAPGTPCISLVPQVLQK